jgi:hypothetical protein
MTMRRMFIRILRQRADCNPSAARERAEKTQARSLVALRLAGRALPRVDARARAGCGGRVTIT